MTNPPYIPERAIEDLILALSSDTAWGDAEHALQAALPALHAAWLEQAKGRVARAINPEAFAATGDDPADQEEREDAMQRALSALGPEDACKRCGGTRKIRWTFHGSPNATVRPCPDCGAKDAEEGPLCVRCNAAIELAKLEYAEEGMSPLEILICEIEHTAQLAMADGSKVTASKLRAHLRQFAEAREGRSGG